MKATARRRRLTSQSESKAESAFVREQRAFERQRQRLLRRYAGQYVALQRGRVVAHDHDDEVLAARMFARVGDASFYIAHVAESPWISEVPSPELAR